MRQSRTRGGPPPEHAHRGNDRDRREGDEHAPLLLTKSEHRAMVQHQSKVEQVGGQRMHTVVPGQPVGRIARDLVVLQFDRLAGHGSEGPRLGAKIDRQTKDGHRKQGEPRAA